MNSELTGVTFTIIFLTTRLHLGKVRVNRNLTVWIVFRRIGHVCSFVGLRQ